MTLPINVCNAVIIGALQETFGNDYTPRQWARKMATFEKHTKVVRFSVLDEARDAEGDLKMLIVTPQPESR